MALDSRKYETRERDTLKDSRDYFVRISEKLRRNDIAATLFASFAFGVYFHPWFTFIADILLFFFTLYFFWLLKPNYRLPFKMPMTAGTIDPNNISPASGQAQKAEGILYLGNEAKSKEEIWFNNSDARTHILYLGTTGSGKTEGLKSLVTNAMGWGSGFIFIDGKADTSLWSSLSSLARRFGRDDDILVLNYMTGNTDNVVPSNTINPFSSGSASYLTNLMVSLMPESQGDNAMWKDRAVALMSALMPVLTWQRNHQEKQLNISLLRDALIFKRVIELSRDKEIPERLRRGLKGYLDTLPGFMDSAFNDDGTEKTGPNASQQDLSTIYQQHGYLAMQFTRQLQSLADDYGYIFEQSSADIDMNDVVLNRRILVVLIPALEKSADETANLGKILGAMLKGMMGATLGSTITGDTAQAIENKPTAAPTPFMAVFDEVGYYTTQGMAVMAAQARSLGFCLVFAAQDMPALEKRVKEEARSITGNCNLKIFGKLEDPTQTREFFEKTIGESMVLEANSQQKDKGFMGRGFKDGDNVSLVSKAKATYGELKGFREGQAILNFGDTVVKAQIFYSNPAGIKSLRINKFVALPHHDPDNRRSSQGVEAVLERFREKGWSAENANKPVETSKEIATLAKGFARARKARAGLIESGILSFMNFVVENDMITAEQLNNPIIKKPKTEKKPEKSVKTPNTAKEANKKEAPKKPEKKTQSTAATKAEATGKPMSWANIASKSTAEPKETTKKLEKDSAPSSSETISWSQIVNKKDKKIEPASPKIGYSTTVNTGKKESTPDSKKEDQDAENIGNTASWEQILSQSKKKSPSDEKE